MLLFLLWLNLDNSLLLLYYYYYYYYISFALFKCNKQKKN